jgi:hypothetical protein
LRKGRLESSLFGVLPTAGKVHASKCFQEHVLLLATHLLRQAAMLADWHLNWLLMPRHTKFASHLHRCSQHDLPVPLSFGTPCLVLLAA